MASCHRRGLSPLTLTFRLLLPCIFAIAALSFLPRLRFISSSNSLQTLYRTHLQVSQRRTEDHDAHFPCPGAASLRGRRPYQEDRILCSPGIHLPRSAARSAGIFGVFDGHLGDAASDFAASSITERFLHHASLRIMSSSNISFMGLDLFEAALIAAISDIDAAFGKRAATHNLKAGSTACLALQVDKDIIVANVGDSRAFICSSCERQRYRSQRFRDFHVPLHNQRAVRPYQRYRHHISTKFEDTALQQHSEGFCVKSLTSDHRPDRPDEKRRIEAFGGFVTDGSVPRVNGQLAVSRSIGDIDFRKYGVIPEPEVSGWHKVSEDNKFLIIASDGIFEKLSPEEVCNLLHALQSGKDLAWVMKRLETNGDSVIALPGTDFRQDSSAHLLKDSSNQDRQELGSGDWPLMSSNLVNKKDGFGVISMPFLSAASSYTQILAHILVEIAFRAGSTDNLSLVIVPLKP